MSSPRIAPVQPPYAEDLQSSFDVLMPPGVPPLNIFRTVGRNPRVLSRMMRGIRNLHVLAYNEIPDDKRIQMVAAVS